MRLVDEISNCSFNSRKIGLTDDTTDSCCDKVDKVRVGGLL